MKAGYEKCLHYKKTAFFILWMSQWEIKVQKVHLRQDGRMHPTSESIYRYIRHRNIWKESKLKYLSQK